MVATCAAQHRGRKRSQEDTFFESDDTVAVFDGHGGSGTSEYLEIFFPDMLMKHRGESDDLESALKSALADIDKKMLNTEATGTFAGSTALVVVKVGDCLTTANVGDCRAVLARGDVAVDLTRDHKPHDPVEKARIEAAGGNVVFEGEMDDKGNPVPGKGIARVNGGLGVARTLGYEFDRPALTPEPEVKTISLNKQDDQFVIVASDGIWDVLSSQDAVSTVLSGLDGDQGNKADMPQNLIDAALKKGAYDNLTVVVMWLKDDEGPNADASVTGVAESL